MKKIKLLALSVLSAVVFNACNTEEVTECDVEGLACTEIFVTQVVSVKSTAGDVVPLDSIVVKVSASEEVLFSENPTVNSEGTFKVISDSEKNSITKEGTDVTFYGYIEGTELVAEDVRVGHDCCHVVFISGKQDIEITYP